jgi:hypothetical protein
VEGCYRRAAAVSERFGCFINESDYHAAAATLATRLPSRNDGRKKFCNDAAFCCVNA